MTTVRFAFSQFTSAVARAGLSWLGARVRARMPGHARQRCYASAATPRIVTQLAGPAPDVSGRPVRAERAILSAVASTDASLLVLPLGKTAGARHRAALVARLVSCSVLAVPAPSAKPHHVESRFRRFSVSRNDPVWARIAGSRRALTTDATTVTTRIATMTSSEVAVWIRDRMVLQVPEVQQQLTPMKLRGRVDA